MKKVNIFLIMLLLLCCSKKKFHVREEEKLWGSMVNTGGNTLSLEREQMLFEAIKANNFEAVDSLVRREGVSLNARTSEDYTPLHLAAQEGHKEVIEYLLKFLKNFFVFY